MLDVQSILTMLLYVSVAILTVALVYVASRIRANRPRLAKLVEATSLIPIPLLAMLRVDVGTDYATYVSIIGHLGGMPAVDYFINGFKGIEPATYLISLVSTNMFGGAGFYFFVFSIVTLLFLYLGLKRLNPPYMFALFFVLLLVIVPLSFNGVRQMAAASILFYATVRLIDTGRYRTFFLLALGSMAFHLSGGVALLVAGLHFLINKSQKQINVKNLGAFYLIILIFAIISSILFVLFAQYVPFLEKFVNNNEALAQGSNRLAYVSLLVFLVLFSRFNEVRSHFAKAPQVYTLALLGVVFMVIGFVSEYLKRLSLYFIPYSYILMAYFIHSFESNRSRKILLLLFILYGLSYFVGIYFILGHGEVNIYKVALGEQV